MAQQLYQRRQRQVSHHKINQRIQEVTRLHPLAIIRLKRETVCGQLPINTAYLLPN